VLPFLEKVVRGKNVPRDRLLEVAEHYDHFGGKSPINDQNRALVAALGEELRSRGPALPVYWGNRNWHPLLADALRQMTADGVRWALAYVTSAYSSYSGCRQYRDDIAAARRGVGPAAPEIDKLRVFYNHPGFIEPQVERAQQAFSRVPADRQAAARLIFTAHSIPVSMAAGCRYEAELHEACRLVSERLGRATYDLVYQSRSGPPGQPWLQPDIDQFIANLAASGPLADVVVVPIGFLSDHLEVLYDLDMQTRAVCERLGVNLVRAATVGNHPRFVRMIGELIRERIDPAATRLALGNFGPGPDDCPAACCPRPARPAAP